jgi:hypothetical protein
VDAEPVIHGRDLGVAGQWPPGTIVSSDGMTALPDLLAACGLAVALLH